MKKPILFTSILIFILIALIYNLVNTKIKLHNYYEISNNIHQISLRNKDFDNYINSTFSYSNFDLIENHIKETKKILNTVLNSSKISKNNINIIKQLNTVKSSIEEKIMLLKKIESHRAVLNNSFRLMQKIHNNIDNKKLTELYTIIMTIDKNHEINVNQFENLIKNTKPKTTYEEYFIKHLNTILVYNHTYKNLKDLSNQLETNKHIDNFLNIYDQYSHNTILDAEISIIIVFAILILLITINLISSFKTIKTNQTLSRFKSAVENSDNIIMVTNKDHIINYVNDAFLKATGYLKNEVLGKTPAILKSGKLPNSYYKNLNKTINAGKIWNGEFINYNKDGQLRYEKASIIPIFNEKQELIEYMP